MTTAELQTLIFSGETFRIECTRSTTNVDKFREAICSFSNDLPNSGLPGYLVIGLDEANPEFRLPITDQLQQDFAAYRSDGQIMPQPNLNVQVHPHPEGGEGEVLVVEVFPHDLPPVRYKGRTCIRIGPRKDHASLTEERQLMERRTANFRTFDATPCPEGDLSRLDLNYFTSTYRPQAIARAVIEENGRELPEQLAALRFYSLARNCPTNAGMLVFAYDPLDLFPGSTIQFVEYDGLTLGDDVLSEKRFAGNLVSILTELDSFLKGRFTQKPVRSTELTETTVWDYPPDAVRELLMNAVLHRNYESNSPIRFYQFSDRIEIQNSGGLYGDVTPENFPRANDYRNPILAEAMYHLGYINRFGRGVARAQRFLAENTSSEATFDLQLNFFLAIIPKHPNR